MLRPRQGFTLIELIVAVLVIFILAALVMPRHMCVLYSHRSGARGPTSQLARVQDAHMREHGRFAKLSELQAADVAKDRFDKALRPGYTYMITNHGAALDIRVTEVYDSILSRGDRDTRTLSTCEVTVAKRPFWKWDVPPYYEQARCFYTDREGREVRWSDERPDRVPADSAIIDSPASRFERSRGTVR